MPDIHHADLKLGRWLPRQVVTPATRGLVQAGMRASAWISGPGEEVVVDGRVRVVVYGGGQGAACSQPGLLWLHGGGYVVGHARLDEAFVVRLAQELGAVVVSVDYRLAPKHPMPAALEDAYTALRWLAAQPAVDPARLAVGGRSAGGGLAASLALYAREQGLIELAFQLLVYPMLDDRSGHREGVDESRFRLWNQAANRFGWAAYLGGQATDQLPPWAVPGRCSALEGLPPAWIGVGDCDLFLEEDQAYAVALQRAGVPCELVVVEGAYHGFDASEPDAGVSRRFLDAQVAALATVLRVGHGSLAPAQV